MFYVSVCAKNEKVAREKLTDHLMSPTLPLVHVAHSPPDIQLDQWTFRVDDDDLRVLVQPHDLGEHVSDVIPNSSLDQSASLIDLDA